MIETIISRLTPQHVLIVSACVLVLGTLLYLKTGNGGAAFYRKRDLKYTLVKRFGNGSEMKLYAALRARFGPQYLVAPKMRMEDVVAVSGSVKGAARNGLRNRVKSRHFDFVICTHSGSPLAAVEFDGPSHGRFGNCADKFKNDVCKRVGLPMHRISYKADMIDAVGAIRL
jgi:hypothetical protein